MSYVGFVNYNSGGNTPIAHTLYGKCDTQAGTAAKTVSLSNFDKLLDGVTIKIKFTYANTVNSPTLNINSTGAKAIQKASGTAVAAADSWKAGQVVSFTYDNTAGAWIMNDFRDYASTSAPGIVKLESTPTFNLTAKGNGGSTSNVVTTSGLYAAYDNLLGAIGTETLNSGFGSNVSIKAAINSLYTTCSNIGNREFVAGEWVTCTYYSPNQLEGTLTVPVTPPGFSYRLACVCNLVFNTIEQVTLQGKMNSKFLRTSDFKIRVNGTGFLTSDSIQLFVLYHIFKS